MMNFIYIRSKGALISIEDDFRATTVRPAHAPSEVDAALFNQVLDTIDNQTARAIIELGQKNDTEVVINGTTYTSAEIANWIKNRCELPEPDRTTYRFMFSGGDHIEVAFSDGVATSITHHFASDDHEEDNFDLALHGLTSLILAQAQSGIDIRSDAYNNSLRATIESLANNLL